MGVLRLAELISREAPETTSTPTLSTYRDKVLAIDASVFICQFDSAIPPLHNRHGQDISIIQGFFNRTIFMLKNGIKPLYVFDGIPPYKKLLRVHKGRKVQNRSGVRSTHAPEHQDLKTLLNHLGVPFIQAPSEAEATCASLVKDDLAWGAVTEDMDALPFGCTRLIRNLKADKNTTITEYNFPAILKKLQLSPKQFVDLCILLGCDYTEKIRGLGVCKALQMIKQYGSIESILAVIRPQDRIPPHFYTDYLEARRLFLNPAVAEVTTSQLKWSKPDEEKILQFLSSEKCMKRDRVQNQLKSLHPAQTTKKRRSGSNVADSTSKKQRKMSDFYKVKKSGIRDKSSMRSNLTPRERPTETLI
ncbi:flap endonuclease 1-like isoform X1 [Mixophyes fleayi]|uniref:flap endonuclease 1-like isoform X1 n=1 Tax=Mixophyes fleayi TaxID=3061075 RepID=UPI003F4E2631